MNLYRIEQYPCICYVDRTVPVTHYVVINVLNRMIAF